MPSETFRGVAGILQRANETMPESTPRAAKNRQRCGPESPKAIGNGGRSSAAAKKHDTQRPGESSVHSASATRIAGAASASLYSGLGANATAAAQAPNPTAHKMRSRAPAGSAGVMAQSPCAKA